MNKSLAVFILFIITLLAKGQDKFDDIIFDNNIRTIQCNSILPLGNAPVIQFDYIGGDAPYMLAKIIHCNWDWTPAESNEIDFINGFNEYTISDVEGGGNGKTPYYHYRLQLPKVKITGNFIIHIFDEDNPKINYITRRFSIFGNAVSVSGKNALANVVSDRFTSQQINFSINYGQYEIQDPYSTLHVVLRQNGRWDNAKTKLKPSFIGIGDKNLRYSFFNGESSFPALKEYRQFDISKNRIGIDSWSKENNGNKYFVKEGFNRSMLNYVDEVDDNGKYSIVSPYDASYSFVYFTLNTSKIEEDIFVFGQLSDWKMDEKFKMNFDSTSKKYHLEVLLKEGEYDYSYTINKSGIADETTYQGSHSKTRNDYDILVYYRPFGKYYDELIAYKKIK